MKLLASSDEIRRTGFFQSSRVGGTGGTDRYLLLFRKGSATEALGLLEKDLGLRIARTSDFEDGVPSYEELRDVDGVSLDLLGVACVELSASRAKKVAAMAADRRGPIRAMEPEKAVAAAAPDDDPRPADSAGAVEAGPAMLSPTWGIRKTNVHRSKLTGDEVRVAVLDTGFGDHPDFTARTIVRAPFVPGLDVDDRKGHGTHCTGITCGHYSLSKKLRYGVASGADIFAGKVLDDQGDGCDLWVCLGIEWALRAKCRVISLSLAGSVGADQAPSPAFEAIGRRARKAGSILIAAAGNHSQRARGRFCPVGHPANCASIMAVGAVDYSLNLYDKSNRGVTAGGGEIDLAGPGVDIFSSWLGGGTNRHHGTSMATAFVSGIAALFLEGDPDLSGDQLWKALVDVDHVRPLFGKPPEDVGSGLVQAP